MGEAATDTRPFPVGINCGLGGTAIRAAETWKTHTCARSGRAQSSERVSCAFSMKAGRREHIDLRSGLGGAEAAALVGRSASISSFHGVEFGDAGAGQSSMSGGQRAEVGLSPATPRRPVWLRGLGHAQLGGEDVERGTAEPRSFKAARVAQAAADFARVRLALG